MFWEIVCLRTDDDAELEVCPLREAEDWVEASFGSACEKMLPMFSQGVSAVRARMKSRVVRGMREEMKDGGDCGWVWVILGSAFRDVNQ
jgi:hypothetical protein